MKEWKDISDNDLDDLFKKASKSVNPVFEEGSWLDLEAKLDNKDIDTKGGFFNARNLSIALAILLITSLIGVKYFGNSVENISDKLAAEKGELVIASEETLNSKATGIENDKGESASSQNEEEIGIEVGSSSASSNNNENELANSVSSIKTIKGESAVKSIIGKEAKGSVNSKITNVVTPQGAAKEFKLKKGESMNGQSQFITKSKKTSTSSGISIAHADTEPKPLGSHTDTEVESESLNTPQRLFSSFSMQFLTSKDVAFYEIVKIPNSDPSLFDRETEKITIAPTEKIESKVYLSFGVSPDFSKVIDNSFLKMGSNWSAQLEYHLGKRWSAHSGIILSKKFYGTGADGMNWPNNWGVMPKEMQGMEGSCNVLDIPLNLRYNLKYDDRAKMYLVGGVSSFLFLNEKYDYLYSEGFDKVGMKTNWNRNENDFLVAGMANFAIGYERKIGNTFSFQVEPFVKIPIRDFGFSQVKLASTGVFFTGKVRLK